MNRADFQGRGDREETLLSLSLSLSPLITLVKFHLRSSRHLPFVFFSFLFLKISRLGIRKTSRNRSIHKRISIRERE